MSNNTHLFACLVQNFHGLRLNKLLIIDSFIFIFYWKISEKIRLSEWPRLSVKAKYNEVKSSPWKAHANNMLLCLPTCVNKLDANNKTKQALGIG